MNIQEAIKSGKPFKRGLNDIWLDSMDNKYIYPIGSSSYYMLSIGDILADDWEVIKPSPTTTRAQFLEAARTIPINVHSDKFEDGFFSFKSQGSIMTTFLEELADKLGLK